MATSLDRQIAQIAEAVERHLHHPRAEIFCNLRRTVSTMGMTTTISSAHNTVSMAALIFSASL